MQAIAIAQHEVLKLFGTRRGWVSVAAFLLVWGVILGLVIEPATRFLSNEETGGIIGALFGERVSRLTNNWATLEVSLYWLVALYVLPVFAVLIAADQMASDRTRGTLRYLLLRCGRFTLFFSRFVGQLFIDWYSHRFYCFVDRGFNHNVVFDYIAGFGQQKRLLVES